MGRKGRQNSSNSSDDYLGSAATATTLHPSAVTSLSSAGSRTALLGWIKRWLWLDSHGAFWLAGNMLLALVLGFSMGAGLNAFSDAPPPFWKQTLGNRIRSTATFKLFTFQGKLWDDWLDRFGEWAEAVQRDLEAEKYAQDPSHPRVFAILREAIIREPGGYVHPDLGLMTPAPCGSSRGIGMVRDVYHKCQANCFPGTAGDKYEAIQQRKDNQTEELPTNKKFRQEEVLVRVPLGFQMTRQVALDTLLPLVPADVQKRASLHELDDAALLVLLLAHERGIGRYSRWIPYIASLPPEPSCGYSEKLRPYMLDAISAWNYELGVDTQGWHSELFKASQYANKIVEGLTSDYGPHLKHPDDISQTDNIKWALCQVASRATAGSEKHGALRMVPILDLVNHDANAGGFIELTGKERLRNGDFVESREENSGTFVLRSMRDGRNKPLRKGQELLANYNVPHYSPLDWFVSLGFIPPERWGKWQRIEPALQRVRTDGPFANARSSTAEEWKEKGARLVEQLRSSEL